MDMPLELTGVLGPGGGEEEGHGLSHDVDDESQDGDVEDKEGDRLGIRDLFRQSLGSENVEGPLSQENEQDQKAEEKPQGVLSSVLVVRGVELEERRDRSRLRRRLWPAWFLRRGPCSHPLFVSSLSESRRSVFSTV
jgi:hypothetical protein